jgi:hypothetical protein
MIGAVIGGAACLYWRLDRTATHPGPAAIAAALAATAVIVSLLPLHTRFGTPWAVIHHLPGASAMRAIDRIQLVTGVIATLGGAAAATEISARLRVHRHRLLRAAALAVLGLAIVEQINTTNTSVIDRRAQVALLNSVRRPPKGCRSFYVVDTRQPNLAFFEYQLDAMLVSQRVSLPTLNGYEAYNPPGWDLASPGSPAYADAVRSWAELKGVQAGLCQLDLGTMRWVAVQT